MSGETKWRVPEGWKLAPIDPTDEMLEAAKEVPGGPAMARFVWLWMLQARPEVPDDALAEGEEQSDGP